MKQQWVLPVQHAQLRNITANVTSLSQERQLLTNWLSSRRQLTGGQDQLTNRVTDHGNETKQFVNNNPSIKSSTLILDNNDNNRSTVVVAENSRQTKIIRIRLPRSSNKDTVNNSNRRARLIRLSTVSTIN